MARPRRRQWLISLALITVAAAAALPAPDLSAGGVDDEKEVRQAVLDYVEGIYEVDPSRIERGVHRNLHKIGFWYSDDEEAYKGPVPMTYQELHDLAGRWNKERRVEAATAVKKVEIFEVLDKTASAKLTADWGVDYMHLARIDGRWMIVNVLWQSAPPGK